MRFLADENVSRLVIERLRWRAPDRHGPQRCRWSVSPARGHPRRGPPECARRGLGRSRGRLSHWLSARMSALRVALYGAARSINGALRQVGAPGATLILALLPIIALPGSEIAPPLGLQIRRCSLGCNGSLPGQTCHARLWPAGPLMTHSCHRYVTYPAP